MKTSVQLFSCYIFDVEGEWEKLETGPFCSHMGCVDYQNVLCKVQGEKRGPVGSRVKISESPTLLTFDNYN